jgi:hypothetical protein
MIHGKWLKLAPLTKGVVAFSQEAITGEMGKSVRIPKQKCPHLICSQSEPIYTCLDMYNPSAAASGAASHNNGVGGMNGNGRQPSQHPHSQQQQQQHFINPVSYQYIPSRLCRAMFWLNFAP